MRRFIIFFLCFFNAADAFTQPQQNYLFSFLGTRRGLASDETSMLQQDEKGFIWIAGSGGLQRFDGRRFLSFHHSNDNTASIPKDEITALYMGKQNRLWILFAGNEAGYMNVQDLSFHPVNVVLPPESLAGTTGRFFADRNAVLMLLINGVTILSYDESSDEFSATGSTLPKGWKPLSVSADHANNYWVGCDSGLVKYVVSKKTFSYREHNIESDPVIQAFSKKQYVTSTCFDRSGRFWLVCNEPGNHLPSFYLYDPVAKKINDKSGQLHAITNGQYYGISGITEQRDGTIWVTGNNMFCRYNAANNSFEPVQNNLPGEFSIRYDEVRSIFEDRENSLWAATNRGLYRFNPEAQFFKTFTNKRFNSETVYNSNVLKISQLRNGDILVNTDGAGIFAYNKSLEPVNVPYINPAARPAETFIYAILERSNGDIWKSLQNGVIEIYHLNTKRSEKLNPLILGGNVAMQLAEDNKGNVWLGNKEGVVVKWDAGNNNFSLAQKFNGAINRLYTDDMGFLWVCTAGSGVYRMNTITGSVVAHYTSSADKGERLLGNTAIEILQYNDSIFLIASDGLNVLNIRTNRFTYFSAENGLLADNVTNIVKDAMGYVWVTAKPWVCSINLQKEVVTTYDERDGVYTAAFNTASGCILKDGRVAIGTSHDIMLFDPVIANESAHKLPPDITITGFSVMNKWLPMDSVSKLPFIELSPGQNSITIELSTLTYQTIYGYFYMLENLDKDWRISPMQNQITFNYLPPGNYVFKSMCKNGDGTMSKNIVQLRIRVKPVFWRTWWFYSLVVVSLIGLIYWMDRERMKRKESMQKIRSDIAGNLHEEVNMALSNINILSEMAKIKTDTDPAKSKEYIEQIHTKSHDMIIAMDDMLWSISPDNDSMQKTVERMKEYIDALKNRHGVNISISIDKKVESMALNMKLRHEALILFKEGIRSLVQAGTRKCEIHIGLEKNSLHFTMQFENAHCDMQQLNNLLHRQDLEKNMRSMQATFSVQVHKTNSEFSLVIPVV